MRDPWTRRMVVLLAAITVAVCTIIWFQSDQRAGATRRLQQAEAELDAQREAIRTRDEDRRAKDMAAMSRFTDDMNKLNARTDLTPEQHMQVMAELAKKLDAERSK